MASVIVCGGGVVGLSVAMMLARDSHDVTVLEADPVPPPDIPADAWDGWTRKGVAQFRQPHSLLSRFREVCDAELPEITPKLEAAGCVWWDIVGNPPPSMTDRSPRPGDERLRMLTGRRPVVEAAVAAAAEDTPGLRVRRGVRVAGLLPGAAAVAGVRHVVGVRTADGDELSADLVVDASGRRTHSADWLAALGGPGPKVEAEGRSFAYYTRYFAGRPRPVTRGPALFPMGSVSTLALPGDNDTWSVTVFGRAADAPLKAVRDPAVFARVVAASPVHAHWLDGRPVSDVEAMGGPLDACRRFAVDGKPVVTGFAAVGDAWACTNPSAGRGLSVGLVHAQLLRRAVAEHGGDPGAFAAAWDAATEEGVLPFYRDQVAHDRLRFAEMEALADGRVPAPPEERLRGLMRAAPTDPDAFRGLVEIVQCMASREEVFARPSIRAILEAGTELGPYVFAGPDRQQLLRLLAE